MRRPNILVLHTDQQRWDTLHANGNTHIKTPNLDRLADRSVNFSHCFVQNPVCMPSRLSLLTGQYCSSLGITHMGVPVPEETETLPTILGRAGYHRALIGKLHFLPHANRDHRSLHPAYDFDHMELSDEPGCYEDAYRAWVRRKAPEWLNSISVGLPPLAAVWQKSMSVPDAIHHGNRERMAAQPFGGPSDLTHTAFVGEQTIEYLRQRSATPFFCFSGFYSPHSPWVVPQEYLDLYSEVELPMPPVTNEPGEKTQYSLPESIASIVQGYYAMISEVDHWVGRILDSLDECGLAENTIVVFTSDHGEWLGEHGRFGKGYWAPDVVSRVPLVVYVPEQLGGVNGDAVSEIVECVDVVPTLLQLAGLQIPPMVQGDVLPVLAKPGPPTSSDDGLGLTEHHGWKSLRGDGFRYVMEEDGSERYYDLASDPREYRNVADQPAYQASVAEARRLLLQRMLRIESPIAREWPY